MPVHKGIEMSIISQVELQAHPEFPHPESSQFTYRSPRAYQGADGYQSPDFRKRNNAYDWTPPSASSDSKADRLLGRQTLVSVYIPSAIGARFWIRYHVREPEELQAQWFYFKLYMNGKPITSWGINAITNPEGQIMRGLFEPSAEFNYTREDGTIMEKGGAESRPFFFGSGPEPGNENAAATDGGLIEVMVYRARGRRRRVQEPTMFKVQEGFGIVMPSEGLIPKPEEAKYYDWHLKDPKDNPLAIFKFHYRSWDTLKSLQLIPESHPMDSYKPTESSLPDWVKQVDENSSGDDDSIIYESSPVAKGTLSNKTPFDESPNSLAKDKGKQTKYLVPPQPENNPFSGKVSNESINSFSSIKVPISRVSSGQVEKPIESPWKTYLARPLPEVPTRQSSLKKPSRHFRNSSNISSASLTPSLKSYVDRQEDGSPEPEVGVANVLQIVTSTPSQDAEPSNGKNDSDPVSKAFYQLHTNPTLDFSQSSIETSPCIASTSATKRRGMSSPPPTLLNYLENPMISPNITLRKTRRLPNIATLKINTTDLSNTTHKLVASNSAISISEGEWMSKSPSPVRGGIHMGSWSPVPGEKKGKGKERDISGGKEFDELGPDTNADDKGLAVSQLRKKAMAWFDKIKASDDAEGAKISKGDERDLMELPNAVKPMPGNWI